MKNNENKKVKIDKKIQKETDVWIDCIAKAFENQEIKAKLDKK